MSDLMLRRAFYHGIRVVQQTRAMFTTLQDDAPVATMTSDAAAQGGRSSSGVVKPLTMMPGPKGWIILGSFLDYFKKENRGQMHEMMRKRHRDHGKIFREQFGPRYNVAIADPSLIKEVLRGEGKYPHRPPYESWVLYKQLRGHSGGLMSSDNEYWRRCRSTLAPKFRTKSVGEYMEAINQVTSDMVRRISSLKDEHKTKNQVPNLLHELNKMTMETILYIMLNKRIGCLDDEVPEPVNQFIQSLATMFLTGHQLMVYANVHKMLKTKPWRSHVQAWDKIYEFAGELISNRIDEVTSDLKNTSPSEDGEPVSFLKYVVGTHQLSDPEIIDNVIEVFMAGIDTTANSIAFMFYLLSKHPEIQTRLVAEVDEVVGKRQVTSADLQKMPFLKACVKENLRLYPIIPMNARVITDDMVIGGYLVPKETIIMMNIYTMSRDETVFHSPDDFIPDRWLKGEISEDHPQSQPFSLVPFGLGSRSCIGRRVAETEIYLAIIQVLQNYWLEKSDDFDIKPSVRTQMTPGAELPVMFIER